MQGREQCQIVRIEDFFERNSTIFRRLKNEVVKKMREMR